VVVVHGKLALIIIIEVCAFIIISIYEVRSITKTLCFATLKNKNHFEE